MQRLSQVLLESAAQSRCGLLLAPRLLRQEPGDMPGVFNAAVPEDPVNAWQTISGAVARDRDNAIAGAIAEGLERLAAARVVLPTRMRRDVPTSRLLDEDTLALFSAEQRQRLDFPWPLKPSPDDAFIAMHRLHDNAEFWVPQECVGLGPRVGTARMPSTSSGLAAHKDADAGPWLALLRAAQEILERDALAVTWINGLGGRQIPMPASLLKNVQTLGGQAYAFDLTQQWNPHPVVAVAGHAACEGVERYALGIACRASYSEAMEKASLEWAQGLTFAGHMSRTRRHELPTEPEQLRRFDEHAAFYTLRPELWAKTAFIAHRTPHTPPPDTSTDAHTSDAAMLQALEHALRIAGIDLYYRELTTPDVADAGLRVMRVLSPQLTGLHADERAPFLGGRCHDVTWRYPHASRHSRFPNPLPHPLG